MNKIEVQILENQVGILTALMVLLREANPIVSASVGGECLKLIDQTARVLNDGE